MTRNIGKNVSSWFSVFLDNRKSLLAMAFITILNGCSGGGGNSADVNVPPPDVIQAFTQTVSTPINTAIEITLRGEGETTLRFDVMALPANGLLTGQLSGVNPVMIYSPDIDYFGTDTLTFDVADLNGNTASGTISIQVLDTVLPTTDTDGDGIVDLEELNRHGTNPELADTDGDGFSDFDEVVTYAFSETVNNFRFNPLLADVPEIDIQLVSQPEIQLNYELSDGGSTTISTNRSDSSGSSWSDSNSGHSTWSSSVSHEAGVALELGYEAEFSATGLAKGTYSAKVTGHYTNTNTEGREHGTSWSSETAGENSTTVDTGDAYETNHSVSTSNGDVLVSAKVVNTGNVSYTLNNLYLNASYYHASTSQPYTPIGTLQYDDPSNSAFPTFTLSPGQATGIMTFKTSPLNVDKVKGLLKNSRGMIIAPSIYDMLDQNGVSYNFSSTGIGTQTALVKIDYIGNGGRENITQRVAVHGNPDRTATAADILNGILNIDTVISDIDSNPAASGSLSSVDGLENNEPIGSWLMMHGKNQGNDELTTITYTTPDDKTRWVARGKLGEDAANVMDDYNLTQITVGGGDILHLVYLQDSDQDGIPNVQEFFYRSDPNNSDTDSDGLSDRVEIDGWEVQWEDANGSQRVERVYSDPTKVDTDSDGLTDLEEANVSDLFAYNRRNPRRRDTDSDGIIDSNDNQTSGVLEQNVFDSFQISNVGSTITGTAPPFNTDTSYTLPASLSGMGTNGFSSYTVATFRLLSTDGKFSEPTDPPFNGAALIIGDTLPCENGVCDWQVVDVFTADASSANTVHQFPETGVLGTGNISGGGGAEEHVKYLMYARIDGNWIRMNQAAVASASTETIVITLKPGVIENARLVIGPRNNAVYPEVRHDSSDPNWVYVWMGKYDWNYYYSSCTPGIFNSDSCLDYYRRYDRRYGDIAVPTFRAVLIPEHGERLDAYDFSGKIISTLPVDDWEPTMVYPLDTGDGQLDIGWNIVFDGSRTYKSNANAISIDGTARIYPADNTTNPIPSPLSSLNGGDDIFTSQISQSGQTGSWELQVPATQGCHVVDFQIHEWDSGISGHNPRYDFDTKINLCRDDSPTGYGIWTATSSKNNNEFGVTRPGNINPIEVTGWASWIEYPPGTHGGGRIHAVTNEFVIGVFYDITVQ